jgi:hypothetical protein
MTDFRVRWLVPALILAAPSLLAQDAETEIREGAVAAVVGVTGIIAYLVVSTVLITALGFAGRFIGGNGPSEFYQHSGKFGILSIFIPGFMVIAAVILGFIYAHITYINPFVYVNVLLTVGLGFGMAMILVFLLHAAKVRSNWTCGLLGLYTGGTTIYCAWATFMYVLITKSEDDMSLGLSALLGVPPFLWEMMMHLNETGWYEMFGSTPTGMVAWGLWAVEAAIIGGIPFISGLVAVRGDVFSEIAGTWNEKQEGILFISEFEPHDASALQKKDFSVLGKYERGQATDAEVFRIDITTNPGDTSLCTCSLLLQTASYDNEGERSLETEDIFTNLLLSPSDLQALVGAINEVPRSDPVYDISEDGDDDTAFEAEERP